jgi:hypothetical protein
LLARSNVKSFPPSRAALILALVAFVLMVIGIGLNYFGGGTVRYSHVAFALTLLAFVVWFSGRKPDND